ncbi:MAG TPA: GerAB/ArcD/ProY family transporter [Syntrophomonadaceae bacterium]|nr:GerAB/ArcD/ProY family transporter [Syntrophomonadaceae bacterium]
MYRISNFQIYCLMVVLVAPIAILEQPKRLIGLTHHNAWLACLATIIPGYLLIKMFSYIIRKSHNPFPYLLEEYLGKLGGRLLSFVYVLVFIFTASFTLSIFVNFIITNVLTNTPISVLIAPLLFVGYVIIKTGFQSFARLCEIIVIVGLPGTFMLILLACFQNIDIANLLPIGYTDIKDFRDAVASTTSILGRLFPILTIAYFSNNPSKVDSVLVKVMFTYIAVILAPSIIITLIYGGFAGKMLVFPVFSLIRLVDIGKFITNIDILFIGIWITGIIASLTLFWYMACFTSQQVFNLKEYGFLAAPTSLIIGVLALMMGPNILILDTINRTFIILVYLLFFIMIPFGIFIMALFKPDKPIDTSSNSIEPTVIM